MKAPSTYFREGAQPQPQIPRYVDSIEEDLAKIIAAMDTSPMLKEMHNSFSSLK